MKLIILYNTQINSQFKLAKLSLYQSFTEGVIFLMKRKTKKGIALLTQVIEKIGDQDNSPVKKKPQSIGRNHGIANSINDK